jgi:hypothetical protein
MSGSLPMMPPGGMTPSMIGPTSPVPIPMPVTDPAQELMAHLTGGRVAPDDPMSQDETASRDPTKRVQRDPPTPAEPRRRLVQRWIGRVQADKKHHKPAFDRMRANQSFTHGNQWDDRDTTTVTGPDTRYVANIALRHVQQRTASLYATNPTVVARTRERMLAVVWDGDMASAQQAEQQLQQATLLQAQQAQITGVPVVPGQMPPGLDPHILAVVTDFKNVQMYHKMLKRAGKTLELLWDYNIDEQTFPFKVMMKMTMRRVIVAGVGYVKLGFQRQMKMRPEIEQEIADMTQRIATIKRISDDVADRELPPDAPEVEQLELAIKGLMAEPQIIVREGLSFDYPDSTAIIPDKKTKSLHGFLGADWVTQEYMLTPEKVQEIYNIDIGATYRAYSVDGDYTADNHAPYADNDTPETPSRGLAAVWEIYHRLDGLVYVVCDGYPDFLQEPAPPDVYLDRFWPWFPLVLNEGYNDKAVFPRSDIDLLRDMQLELNRARQGLREHRKANRPKTIVAGGILEPDDKEKLASHPANAVIELNGLAPGAKVEDLLQAFKPPPIDPALYDTNATFEDILRVLGQDQASMGQTTSATATEAAVAQSSQHTDLSSCIDDQDDLLSELAQAGGKLLLLNVSADTVKKVIGPGAVWPELSKQDIVENIYLEVQAGSTGRPNKQQEVQNAQILFPMLQRVPGISPEWMARELIKRLDDRLDLDDAFVEGLPSMDAINRIQGTVATPPPQDPPNPAADQAQGPGPPPASPAQAAPASPNAPPMAGPNDPNAQGPNGGRNARVPNPPNGLLGPRMPPMPGANGLMPGRGGGPRLTPQGGLPTP